MIRAHVTPTVFPMSAFFLAVATAGYGDESLRTKVPNEQAVAEVGSGRRTEANAAWWGFDEADATESLQAAVDSGVAKLIIPYMGRPWIIRPVKLRSNLEIIFEPGVLVLAKKGEFMGKGDSLFHAADQTDITIRGYGATLRMRKKDYQNPPYPKAEWRMGLRFVGCKRVHVEGVRVESSGGDGIYIGSSGKLRWCEDVVIRNVVCHDNHRQGMSVIGAVNLLVENSVFSDTQGTPPEAGIDLEPDSPDERLVNCVIRNCVFENNAGHAILVYLKPQTEASEPVTIRFENCLSRMGHATGPSPDEVFDRDLKGWSGMAVGTAHGPSGLIEFRDCVTENTGKEGVKVFDQSADSVKIRFVNCSWRNPWVSRHPDYGGPRVPILIHLRRPELSEKPGGIEFIDCHVYDDAYRPVLQFEEDKSAFGVRDLTGTITVHSPHEPRMKLGPKTKRIDLELVKAAK